jgi:hypothetical protein
MYNISDELLHKVFYYNKKTKISSFYFNKYKKILPENLNGLPFDTENFITYEVIGYSAFAISNNKNIYVYNKYKTFDRPLNDYIENDYKLKYLLNKYSQ